MGSTKEQLDKHLIGKFERKVPADYFKRLASEMPQHKVRISKPFYISANEVTIGQFSRFRNDGKGYITELDQTGKGGTGVESGKEAVRKREFNWLDPGYKPSMAHPVTNVTWKDATAYCAWLSERDKKIYRLPTEAEWEYACRAGTQSMWSFAEDLDFAAARGHMWFSWFALVGKGGNNPLTPHPVGEKKANAFGLCDMHGNVAEMCSDYFAPTYYERCVKEGLVADPKRTDPKDVLRVVRGGSFLDLPHLARSAWREGLDPALGSCKLGFRIVCEIELPTE